MVLPLLKVGWIDSMECGGGRALFGKDQFAQRRLSQPVQGTVVLYFQLLGIGKQLKTGDTAGGLAPRKPIRCGRGPVGLRHGFGNRFWGCGEAHAFNCKCELLAFTKIIYHHCHANKTQCG
jgi:hypothetical protein